MKILIAAPCRQDEETFKYYLESLDNLEKPCQTDRLFVLHNSPHLAPLVKDYMYYEHTTDDDYPRDVDSHIWTRKNVSNISRMKNAIAEYALYAKYDHIFFVDSDLILHPKTLVTLLEAQKDIVAEIFWTKFSSDGIPLPNCWMYDGYDGVCEETMELWRKPGLYRVGMTGACILIHRKVFEKGVNYSNIYNVSFEGEDRFFCIRAACAGFDIWIDTHFPCRHLYRQADLKEYVENGGYKAAFTLH